jgi:hypothetical protein
MISGTACSGGSSHKMQAATAENAKPESPLTVPARNNTKCGSNVYWEGDSNRAVCGITVGSFADPNFPLPTYSQWENSKHDWLRVSIVTEHYPQARPLQT